MDPKAQRHVAIFKTTTICGSPNRDSCEERRVANDTAFEPALSCQPDLNSAGLGMSRTKQEKTTC